MILPPPPPPRMEPSGVKGSALVVLIAAGGLLAGSFMPWVTVSSVFGEVSVDGIDKDGKITAVLAVIVGVVILTSMQRRSRSSFVECAVVAAVAAAVSLYDWTNVNDAVDSVSNEYAVAKVGTGLYLCVGASVVAFVAALAEVTRGQPSSEVSQSAQS